MAKKARTPTPPRKVQAPKRRDQPRAPRGPVDRSRLYLYALGGSGIVALVAVIVVLAVVVGKGGGTNIAAVRKTMLAAGCTFTTAPGEPGNHMKGANQNVIYNTYPPSNGTHNPTPAIWQEYSQVVDPRQAVHNLEHGGIIVWYGPGISDQGRLRIDQFYNSSPDGILVTPILGSAAHVKYPPHKPLGSRIALSAWYTKNGLDYTNARGIVSVCGHVNVQAFEKFRDAFRGKGPERVPVQNNAPGT